MEKCALQQTAEQHIPPLHSVSRVRVSTSIDQTLATLRRCRSFITPSATVAPSLRLAWQNAFIAHYGTGRELAITMVGADSPQLLLPLQRRDRQTLSFICDETADYNDFFFERQADNHQELLHDALRYWLNEKITRFDFSRIPADSRTVTAICAAGHELGLKVSVADCDTMTVVDAHPGIAVEHWPGVRATRIKKLQRRRRTLNRRFAVNYRLVETHPELDAALERAMQLHIDRWAARGITSKFLDARRKAFTEEVCHAALHAGTLMFSLLEVEGEIVSYQLCFIGNKTAYWWNTSFALHWHTYSPGALLLLETLERSEELGFNKLSFMRGDEAYKGLWSTKTEHTLTITLERT